MRIVDSVVHLVLSMVAIFLIVYVWEEDCLISTKVLNDPTDFLDEIRNKPCPEIKLFC